MATDQRKDNNRSGRSSNDSGNQDYFRKYNDAGYRGPGDESKGMGNDFTSGNFGSNTRSDGYYERTSQEAGSSNAARGMQNPYNRPSNRGKGPRNYQRSGERIREDVSERLKQDAHIDASDIEVTVENSEVTLKGTVRTRQEKRHAEDITDSISGVKNVKNQIRVSGEKSAERDTSSPQNNRNTIR